MNNDKSLAILGRKMKINFFDDSFPQKCYTIFYYV